MPKNVTFDQLLSVMANRAGGAGLPSKQSMGNARSALVGLVRALQLDMRAKVGATLREGFPAALEEFRGQLRRLGRGRQSINNKTSSHTGSVATPRRCAAISRMGQCPR